MSVTSTMSRRGDVTLTAMADGARGLLRYARFTWGVLAFNLLVILWGAFVRATGSGAGCGSHWPLCNGEVVPRSPTIATLIELGHRLTSGIALLLVGALVVGAWRRFPRTHPVRRAAAWSAGFLVTEALIGAGLVLLELVADNRSLARGYWVAGHLINTYLLVGALTLTAWFASGGPRLRRAATRPVLTFTASVIGLLILGVSGAVTALGDTLFPASTFAEAKALTFSDSAHVFVRLRLWHPTLALAVGAVLLLAARRAAAVTAATSQLAVALIVLYAVQLALGLANVWLLAPVALQILHLLLSHLIWIALILMIAGALGEPRRVPSMEG